MTYCTLLFKEAFALGCLDAVLLLLLVVLVQETFTQQSPNSVVVLPLLKGCEFLSSFDVPRDVGSDFDVALSSGVTTRQKMGEKMGNVGVFGFVVAKVAHQRKVGFVARLGNNSRSGLEGSATVTVVLVGVIVNPCVYVTRLEWKAHGYHWGCYRRHLWKRST